MAVKQMQWFLIRAILTSVATVQPDFDVQLQIKHILIKTGQAWPLQHVRGHQSSPDLSWEAKLNIIADMLATEAQAQITLAIANHVQFQYPAVKIHLIINGNTITCSFL
eukprot:9008889-Ditylum_brightwellii.AAC.2